jgi:hypothetical protein
MDRAEDLALLADGLRDELDPERQALVLVFDERELTAAHLYETWQALAA